MHYSVFGKLLARAGESGSRQPFLTTFDGRKLTFSDFASAVKLVKQRLLESGMRESDTVASVVTDPLTSFVFGFATLDLGGCYAPLNPALTESFISTRLEMLQPRYLVVDDPVYLATLRCFEPYGMSTHVGYKSGHVRACLAMHRSGRQSIAIHDGPAMVLSTSGTTGPPKGAVISERYLLTAAERIATAQRLSKEHILFTTLRPFHINPWVVSVIPAMLRTSQVALGPKFSTAGFWRELARLGATHVSLIGSMVRRLLIAPESDDDSRHSVKVVYSSPPPPAIEAEFCRRFNVEFVVGYGQTEAVPLTLSALGEYRPPGSSGRPMPGFEVAIVDDHGRVLPPDTVGEIVCRANLPGLMFDGYLNDPDATAAALRGGWYHTGDLGHMSSDGHLYYRGRVADVVRNRGERVSAFEIENALLHLEGIAEVAVHSVGEAEDIKACIVPRRGMRIDVLDLAGQFERLLPIFARPRYVEIVDELPTNASLRIDKQALIRRGLTDKTVDLSKIIDLSPSVPDSTVATSATGRREDDRSR